MIKENIAYTFELASSHLKKKKNNIYDWTNFQNITYNTTFTAV